MATQDRLSKYPPRAALIHDVARRRGQILIPFFVWDPAQPTKKRFLQNEPDSYIEFWGDIFQVAGKACFFVQGGR